MPWPEGEGVGALGYLERVVISSAPGKHGVLVYEVFFFQLFWGGERGRHEHLMFE